MHDAIIVGGGPGGLYVSTLLAREGFDVIVAEEHMTAGEPVHCTGVLATEAFDEFDIARDSILNQLRTARFFGPGGESIEHSTPKPEALVIDRAIFDRNLQTRAEQAGASVRVGSRVTSVQIERRGVVVRCQSGTTLRARTVVLACGANYTLQKKLGLGMPSTFLRSAQMEMPAGRTGPVEVRFGQHIAPKGFAWIVPLTRNGEPRARVGLMCDRDASAHFRQFATSMSANWGLRWPEAGEISKGPRQKILPLAPIARTYGDRLLAVGDAAGLVKATTGGGIYYSLVSSHIAANVLSGALRANRLDAAALRPYEKQWRGRLGSELRAQLALRVLAERLGDAEINALFELARTNGVMSTIGRAARFNHHRGVIVSVLKHAPVRRVLFKQLVARTPALSPR
jgi:geranylgeranyl reductase family protein